MTRKVFLSIVLCLLASVAAAQELRVRSGEHSGFTRLVVQIPSQTRWALQQEGKSAQLSVALNAVTFETRSVFDRLSAQRLIGVQQDKPGDPLTLTLGCDCIVTGFLHQDTMVVLDIAPGLLPETVAKTDALGLLVQQNKVHLLQPAEISPEKSALPLLQINRRELEDVLMLKVLAGADRDVVDLTLAEVGPRRSRTTDLRSTVLDGSNNLMVTSVLDDLRSLQGLTEAADNPRQRCISNAELDLDAWAGTTPFSKQVPKLRDGLFQEFDKLDEDRATALAKLYASHGFGAEAIQVLELLPDQSSEQNRIRAIAMIADKDAPLVPNLFAGQQRCDGNAALWGLLAVQELRSNGNLVAIEQSFARLPRHLRHQFGPRVAEILARADQLEASRRILRVTDRTSDAPQPGTQLVKARIAEAEGDQPETEVLLKQAVDTPDSPKDAPLAVARLIQKHWSDRSSVSQRELDLAAAYSVELRRSEQGPMMARAHALALALTGEFDAALVLTDASDHTRAWDRTHEQILQLLSERAGDITFLRHALEMTVSEGPFGPDTITAVAVRLTEIGFPDEAAKLSARHAKNSNHRTQSQIKARVAMQDGRPRQALLELTKDNTTTGMLLRAKALQLVGDYERAADLLAQLGDLDAAQRNMWRAGSFNDIAPASKNKFAKLAKLSASMSQPIERNPDKQLADATALLGNSQGARQNLKQMRNILNTRSLNQEEP